jgi:S-adenosyl-L-methionine hydrolase (adenosine-forming)
VIVLFTDFGLQGPYMGQMKAVLRQMAPGILAVDLFADAPVGNPRASAYLLAAYAEWFAAGTVFLAVLLIPASAEHAHRSLWTAGGTLALAMAYSS